MKMVTMVSGCILKEYPVGFEDGLEDRVKEDLEVLASMTRRIEFHH